MDLSADKFNKITHKMNTVHSCRVILHNDLLLGTSNVSEFNEYQQFLTYCVHLMPQLMWPCRNSVRKPINGAILQGSQKQFATLDVKTVFDQIYTKSAMCRAFYFRDFYCQRLRLSVLKKETTFLLRTPCASQVSSGISGIECWSY